MAIILASASPRRQELMRLLGVDFTIHTADIDERMDRSLPPEQEVERLAREKAAAIAALAAPEDIVVAADTIVVCQGEVLGKPKTEADAARMLHLLSGRTHAVMTGLCVQSGARAESLVSRSQLRFRALSDAEINAYIATGEPMDKAGSYGIQGRASVFVEHLDGDYFSVMGLPLCPLTALLRRFGVRILNCPERR